MNIVVLRTKSHPFLILFFLMFFVWIHGQNGNKRSWVGTSFTPQRTFQDSLGLYQERVVLHIANQEIDKGNIFFKAYLISGLQNLRSSISSVLNVELVDVNGAVLKKQPHRIINGMVEGGLELPKSIEPGIYYLRAYTRWMKNYDEYFFAKKQIQVGGMPKETQDHEIEQDLNVIPESGLLMNGYDNRIVVKLPFLVSGEGNDVGRILDQNSNVVGTIKNYFGIGTAFFKPRKGMNYHMELENDFVLPLPMAKDQGCLLQVNNLDPNNINIRVTATSDFMGSSLKLVGMLNETKYFEDDFVIDNGNIKDLVIPKEELPKGILVLTLKDNDGRELAKRPVWIDKERLHINISQVDLHNQEPVYRIKVTDHNNMPVSTQLAISINKSESHHDTAIGKSSMDWSDLFRLPELKIVKDGQTDRNRRFLRDLIVLLSKRDPLNDSLLDYHLKTKRKYPVQNGLEVMGYAYDLNNNLLVDTQIQIMLINEEKMSYMEAKTDANGLLKIKDLQVDGNTTLVFRTEGQDTKSNLVKVIMTEDWEVEGAGHPIFTTKNEMRTDTIKNTSGPLVDPIGLIELEEVEVDGNRPKVQKSMQSVYGIDIPESRIKYQDPKKLKSIPQLISEIPGVAVMGMGNFIPSVRITRANGAGPVLFVIDGIPLTQGSDMGAKSFFDPGLNSLAPIMNLVSAVDIERIELLTGPDASIYGSRASGGVILVYTRSGKDSNFIKRKEGQLVLSGYEPTLDFETYQQDLSKKSRKETSLLYWNPKLETDKNGEAIVKLPASSNYKYLRIEASTITPDGKVGWSSSNF